MIAGNEDFIPEWLPVEPGKEGRHLISFSFRCNITRMDQHITPGQLNGPVLAMCIRDRNKFQETVLYNKAIPGCGTALKKMECTLFVLLINAGIALGRLVPGFVLRHRSLPFLCATVGFLTTSSFVKTLVTLVAGTTACTSRFVVITSSWHSILF